MGELNCLQCQYRHDDNGNCTAAGGFCTAVPAAHCRLLQEYLDTGLTPESVEAIKLSMMGKAISEITEFEGLPIERLKELARVDREGRVVVLPCRVGDTVYMIERIFDIDNGVCDEICARKVIGHGGNNLDKLWLVGSGGICNVSIFVSEFGKTVFLSREEAEAEIERRKNDCNG